jgi:hypothetical protein
MRVSPNRRRFASATLRANALHRVNTASPPAVRARRISCALRPPGSKCRDRRTAPSTPQVLRLLEPDLYLRIAAAGSAIQMDQRLDQVAIERRTHPAASSVAISRPHSRRQHAHANRSAVRDEPVVIGFTRLAIVVHVIGAFGDHCWFSNLHRSIWPAPQFARSHK